jgi:uncharacterized membrane protein YkvA (DUF1232 family)
MWFLRLRKFLKSAGKEALILLWAFRNPATPTFVKLGTILLALYAISPIDLVPDVPLVGWLDDAAILMLGIPFLIKRLPETVRLQALAAAERTLARFGLNRSASN